VLEHLRAIRATQPRHEEKFEEVILRLGNLERDFAALRGDLAGQQVRLEGFDASLDAFGAAL